MSHADIHQFWSPESVRAAVHGTFLSRPPTKPPAVEGLSIDSRSVLPGQIFLAIKGEKTDGHLYVEQAVDQGAAAVIVAGVDRLPAGTLERVRERTAVIAVPDTHAALIRLATLYRRALTHTKVIAIAGSNGKTTTKGILHAILSAKLRGSASPKSFNNNIGVPLTILAAKAGDQYLICETGTNAPGELADLAPIAAPDLAVITSIGREHLEGLGSLAGVMKEEASILHGLAPGGAVVLTADVPGLEAACRAALVGSPAGAQATLMTFGESEAAQFRVGEVRESEQGVWFTLNERAGFRVPLLGRHNALNATAAIAVARRMGLSDEEIRVGLATVRPADMRLSVSTIAGVTVLNDAYNANPDSVLAALKTFDAVARPDARRVVVLGDMLELGSQGPELHGEIGTAAAGLSRIDLAVFAGPLMAHAAQAALATLGSARVVHEPMMSAEAAERIAALLEPGDWALVKGSRGSAMERVIRALTERRGAFSAPVPAKNASPRAGGCSSTL